MSSSRQREDFARGYLDEVGSVLAALPAAPIAALMDLLHRARGEGRTLFIAGNGGSAATASHMACDMIRTIAKGGRPPLRAIALSDNVPLLTALGNDVSYDDVFAGQLRVLGARGDVLLVISASGNSPNVLRVIASAREMGIATAGLLGMGGGAAAAQVDVAVVVPSGAYGPIEDAHLVLNHLITAYLAGH